MKESDRKVFDFGSAHFIPHTIADSKFKPIPNIIYHQTELLKSAKAIGLDLLHLPSIRRVLFRKSPCPSVVTVHDLAVFHLSGKYDIFRTFYNKHIALPALKNNEQIITVSEFTKKDLIQYGKIENKKITVIPNGVDSSRFFQADKATAKKTISEKYKIDTDYILYTARLEHPAKNHIRLINAFVDVVKKTNWRGKLLLAGSPWSGAEVIYKRIADLNMKDKIICVGFVPEEDLPAMYAAAELFVFPSLFEGFGIPPVEAMASGTPVACSKAASLPEVVSDAGILFDPIDESSISSAVISILSNSVVKNQYIKKGLERAKLYSWVASAHATHTVYMKAISSNLVG